jgi:xanthine dehydrogenase accessory factor
MIGSKIKVVTMRNEFISNGWSTSSQWEKIHTPIGLEINSHTVEEIAVSIAAELILIRNSRN